MSVDFAPDGRLVTAGRDQIVRVWDGGGKKLTELEPLPDIALHAVFAQQGAQIVSADITGDIRVNSSADAKRTGQTDTNPPTIAERIVDSRRKLAEAEAASAKAAAELAAAQDAAAKANAAIDAATKEATAKQADLGRVKQASAQSVATQPAATQASAKIPAETSAVQKATAELAAANAAIQQRADAAKSANAIRAGAEQAANAAKEQLERARAELHKWQLAEVSAQLAAAQADFASFSGVNDQLAKALAQMESANRALTEGPQRIATAEQRLAKAKQSHAAAVQAEQAAASAVAQREAIVQKNIELSNALQAQATTKPSADPSIVTAAAKLKESLELLSAGLQQLRASAASATDVSKKAAKELAAAEAELSTAKANLAAAPAQLDQARKLISQSVVQQLQAAKDRIDRLQAQKKQLEGSPAR
jgi:chromosome segregation ATPase